MISIVFPDIRPANFQNSIIITKDRKNSGPVCFSHLLYQNPNRYQRRIILTHNYSTNIPITRKACTFCRIPNHPHLGTVCCICQNRSHFPKSLLRGFPAFSLGHPYTSSATRTLTYINVRLFQGDQFRQRLCLSTLYELLPA